MVGILKKNIFNRFVVNAVELAILSGFWRKNGKELLELIVHLKKTSNQEMSLGVTGLKYLSTFTIINMHKINKN